ncbi:MAG: four helix bundle protein [Planctomycetaceae bacterium]|jgi:four helix bundle protein|nr:four helix bundle protein [Planctomycetaceae bacterium]
MKQKNIIAEKSFDFAVRIVKLYRFLCTGRKEYVLSKQFLRSGTSIGANVYEALQGQSRKDFVSKMSIALKEAAETVYWIKLLTRTEYLTSEQGDSIHNDCTEIIRILHSIVKTTKDKVP